MRIETLLFWFLASMLGGIAIIAVYYERRRRRFEPTPTRDHIFRCEKCSFVYTDDEDVDRSRCPQCGTHNEEFKF